MTAQEKLDNLLELARSLKVAVRYEPMGGAGGGLCVLRGKAVLFVDVDAHTQIVYERVLLAMAEHFDLDAVYLKPQIRRDLEYLQR